MTDKKNFIKMLENSHYEFREYPAIGAIVVAKTIFYFNPDGSLDEILDEINGVDNL
jgi:hypothetical protein